MKKNQFKTAVIISILSQLIFVGAVRSQNDINDTTNGKADYADRFPCIPYLAPPSNLVADSITSNSAQLHASGSGLITIYYKLLAAPTWTFAPGGIASSLLPNTEYEFYATAYKYVCNKYLTSKSSAFAYFTTLHAASHSSINTIFFPNPSHGLGMLSFTLPQPGYVLIKLFDKTGRTISTINKGNMPEGEHHMSIVLDNGSTPAGLYFVSIETSFGLTETKKIILIK